MSDDFAMRQFIDPGYTGTKVDYDPKQFEDKVSQPNFETHDGNAEPDVSHSYPNFEVAILFANIVKDIFR